MVKIELDSDPSKIIVLQPKNFQNLQQLHQEVMAQFGLQSFEDRLFGFKDKGIGTLMEKIEDISNFYEVNRSS